MRSKKLGANINETLAIKGAFGGLSDSAYRDVYSAFKEEILGVNGVKSITAL